MCTGFNQYSIYGVYGSSDDQVMNIDELTICLMIRWRFLYEISLFLDTKLLRTHQAYHEYFGCESAGVEKIGLSPNPDSLIGDNVYLRGN